jgi:hypothetical protein
VFSVRYELEFFSIRPLTAESRVWPVVSLRFGMEKVTLELVFLPVIWLLPVSITPPLLHLHLNLAITRTNGLNLGNFQQSI